VQVIFREFEGAIHGFNALAGVAPDYARTAQEFLASSIRSLLEK